MHKQGLLKVNMQQSEGVYDGDSDSSDEEMSKQRKRQNSITKVDKLKEKMHSSANNLLEWQVIEWLNQNQSKNPATVQNPNSNKLPSIVNDIQGTLSKSEVKFALKHSLTM